MKLYVYSVISPSQRVVSVEIEKIESVIGLIVPSDSLKVTNATVRIVSGKGTIGLWYDRTNKFYRVSADTLPIKPKLTYTLLVNMPEGLSAKATCTVPDTVLKNEDISIVYSQKVENTTLDTTFLAQATFKNIDGESDYYDLIYDKFLVNNNQSRINFSVSWGLFEGKNNLGKSLVSKLSDYQPQRRRGQSREFSILSVLTTDVNYYRYHKTLLEFQLSKSNPFAESSPIFSNVEGGVGVFAAYIRNSKLL
ncbi:MAG: DUF4249 domain-containing protein [Saprospiraceae bacterium]|nr:DUF4249 domain-containing protein [Saprospiraceae bacterium]